MKALQKLCFILILLNQTVIWAQDGINLLQNGTFLGDTVNYSFPYHWKVCPDNPYYIWNDPNTVKIDRNNGIGKPVLPINGTTFMRLRAHGRNYIENAADSNFRETREFITQKLQKKLEANTVYLFSVFLCFNSIEQFPDSREPGVAHPMKLDILVSNDSCLQTKRLWQSGLIENTVWKEYQFVFNTWDEPFQYLTLQIQWDTIYGARNIPYNGMMELDSARLVKICTMDTISEVVEFNGVGRTVLKAPQGVVYNWDPAENLSDPTIQEPTITRFAEKFSVAYKVPYSDQQCPILKTFFMHVNCDNVHPKDIIDTTVSYYRKDQKVILEANEGKKYSWDYDSNLSALDVRKPYLKGYSEFLNVQVTDELNCTYKQVFHIIKDCKLLNPVDPIIKDTTIKAKTGITLVPRYGNLFADWSPPNGLSCTSCLTPYTEPNDAETYQVILIDEFGCKHTEVFNIKFFFYAPNFISPNGDGINDCFKILGLPENTSIRISDKSGHMVFASSNYNNEDNCWDGVDINGQLLPSGTYWYVIENKGVVIKKGFVFVKY